MTDKQMDAAIERWRRTPTVEQLYADLSRDPEFKAALEAAAERAIRSDDPSQRFWEIDANGWRPSQFNVDIPPARPSVRDPSGPGADPRKVRMYERHPDDPFPTY